MLLCTPDASISFDSRGYLIFGNTRFDHLDCRVKFAGADQAAFADVGASGEIFAVESGQIARRS